MTGMRNEAAAMEQVRRAGDVLAERGQARRGAGARWGPFSVSCAGSAAAGVWRPVAMMRFLSQSTFRVYVVGRLLTQALLDD